MREETGSCAAHKSLEICEFRSSWLGLNRCVQEKEAWRRTAPDALPRDPALRVRHAFPRE
jgi:hypothetical protein